jgi:hypothetical protein
VGITSLKVGIEQACLNFPHYDRLAWHDINNEVTEINSPQKNSGLNRSDAS